MSENYTGALWTIFLLSKNEKDPTHTCACTHARTHTHTHTHTIDKMFAFTGMQSRRTLFPNEVRDEGDASTSQGMPEAISKLLEDR